MRRAKRGVGTKVPTHMRGLIDANFSTLASLACQRGVNVVLIEKLFLHLLEWIHVGTLKEDPISNVPF